MWVNAQHLMSRLAKENKVLYINNMGLRPPSASKSDLAKIWRRVAEWLHPPKEEAPGCFVLSPITIPFHKYAIIRKLNQWLLKNRVKKWASRLGFESPILWIFLPTGFSLVGKLSEQCVVYHCVDDYAQNPNVPSELINEMEGKLLKAADITFVTNPKLLEKRRSMAKRIRYFPNTADVPRFRDFSGPLPKMILEIKEKSPHTRIIGYQGNISNYKTDLQLLEKIGKSFPDDHLVLVGPAGWGDPTTDIGRLDQIKNIHLAGRVPYDDLPAWLHGFDVCLIPMNINESTKGSFPMKFYEYMACGKPIVSVALPAFESYREKPSLVRIADNHDDFILAVQNSLEDTGNQQTIENRIAEAKKNDWDQRVLAIGHEVGKLLLNN